MALSTIFTLSSLLPLVGAIFVYTLGFFVWIKKIRDPLSILFFCYCFVISMWLFGTFKLFNAQTDELAIFWDRFIYVGVAFIPIFLYHFGLIYCQVRSQKYVLWFGYLLALIFLSVSQSDLFVKDLFQYSWGVHTRAQVLHHPFLVYFFSYFILYFINLFRYYFRATGETKQQVKYLLIGFFVLDAIGPLAFLPAYGISVYPIIFLSALPFVLLVAYAMVKYNALDAKVLSVEVFSAMVTILFMAEFFLSLSWEESFLRFIALALVVFFVIMLLKSVHGEVSKREKIESLNTDLHKAAKSLEKKNYQLQVSHKREIEKANEVLKLKDEFVFIAAHELKAPVFAIKGFLELAQEPLRKLPKKVREYMANIFDASVHLNKLVNDLLQVARDDAGTMKVDAVSVDVLPIVERILTEQEGVAKKRKIAFVKKISQHPSVLADESKITEVLTNLVNNAIKYNKDGGTLTVTFTPKAHTLEIDVADTGHGIPKDQQAKIFGKFFRASGKATEGVLGTGLGLFITKMLVEKMGGVIAFTSVEGRGTTFTVVLPRSSVSQKE